MAFESRRRFKDYYRKTTNYLNFDQILRLINDEDKQMLCCDEYKKVDEKKFPVYHAVFKSRVNRFSKMYKYVSILYVRKCTMFLF